MRSADCTKPVTVAQLMKKRAPRPRAATIARFVQRIVAALPIQVFGCESQLKWLLSEEALGDRTAMFADRLRRLASDRRLTDDELAQMIVESVEYSARNGEEQAALAPAHEALLVFACATATTPSVIMHACRCFVSLNATDPVPFPAPFDEMVTKAKPHPRKRHDVENVVAHAVKRTVAVVVSASLSPSKLATWKPSDREAGLTALWLAYSHTRSGTTGESLLKQDLIKDFVCCGAPIWHRLVAAAESSKAMDALKARWSNLQLARMTISLQHRDDEWEWEDEEPGPLKVATGTDRGSLVVCPFAIVPASDKYDKDEVERHQILETALPLAAIPSAQQLNSMMHVLLEEFPWASQALDTIFTDLIGHANLGAPSLRLPATLLVGPAGSGKSRLVRRLAEVLELPRLDISVAGTSDTKVLAGTSRGWASGRPSGMATLLAKHKTASALVMLDELDKANDQARQDGGLSAYLLGLLEPETARRHYDVFLKTECDFSGISWLCTANLLTPLSKPMLSRLRVLYLAQPGVEHFEVIAEGVMRELSKRYGVARDVLPPLNDLQIDLRRLSSARQVRTAVEASIGHWSRDIVRH